jgi:hypothetical protein
VLRFTFTLDFSADSNGGFMSEWAKRLAEKVRQKHESEGIRIRAGEHRERIISARAQGFFDETVARIKGLFEEFDEASKEYATAFRTKVLEIPNAPNRPGPVHKYTITRSACPKITALLELEPEKQQITLSRENNGRDTGTTFAFEVGDSDGVYVAEAFGESAQKFQVPADLAQYIVETLLVQS